MSETLRTHYEMGAADFAAPRGNWLFRRITKMDRMLFHPKARAHVNKKPWVLLPASIMEFRGGGPKSPLTEAPAFDNLTDPERSALALLEGLVENGRRSDDALIAADERLYLAEGGLGDFDSMPHFTLGIQFCDVVPQCALFRTRQLTVVAVRIGKVRGINSPVNFGARLIRAHHKAWSIWTPSGG